MMLATSHHVGCAVRGIDEAARIYAEAFGVCERSRSFEVASQNVRVCFLRLNGGFFLELTEPLAGSSTLAHFFQVGFYHLCFLVEDIVAAGTELRRRGFTAMPPFQSEAFDGHACQFLLNPQLHLIELAQMSAPQFERHFRDQSPDSAPEAHR